MFFLYNRTNRVRVIARELQVARYYPYERRMCVPQGLRYMTHNINWGCVHLQEARDETPILNSDLTIAASKVATYAALGQAGIPCPKWTTWGHVARSWETMYLGRQDFLSGGKGITIYQVGDRPGRHDFYTQVVPCRREFRVHVFGDDVIAIQKKRIADAVSIIHNHDNGVLFEHKPLATFDIGAQATALLKASAIGAVHAVALDFGAVDIIQDPTGAFWVLEVNTAPGIRTEPIYAAYRDKFQTYLK